MYIQQSPGRACSIEQERIHIQDQAFSSVDCKDPPPFPTSRSQSASTKVIPNVQYLLHVCNFIQKIVAEEVGREHAKLSQYETRQAMENGLPDIFFTDYTEVEGELAKASNQFIQTDLINMAEKNSRWGIRSQYQTVSTVYNIYECNQC